MKLRKPRNQILFLSRQSDTPSLDISMLAEELNRKYPEYRTKILCKKIGSSPFSKLAYCFHILKQMNEISVSKAVILDSYCIPVSMLDHRHSLIVIQMWHSIGTMKKFGYSILDKPEGSTSKLAHAMRMHFGYTYVLAAGEGYKAHLAAGFNFPKDRILTYPLPRVQLLQDEKYIQKTRKRIFSDYPQLSEKENIVYVPTFRKTEDERTEFEKAVNKLADSVDYSKYNLIVKAHPLADFSLSDSRVINDSKYTSMEMLLIADAVISDYSCIIYEAAVLKKPLYFYTYDYDHYMKTRDIYMNYRSEVPGPICNDPQDLLNCISTKKYDYSKLERFLHKYVETNGHECENLAAFIVSSISHVQ